MRALCEFLPPFSIRQLSERSGTSIGTLTRVVLAPLFCMGYFGAPLRRRGASIGLTIGIVILVVLVRKVEQPWRGIIDAGVVLRWRQGLVPDNKNLFFI